MTENEVGLLSSVELERKNYIQNVVKPLAGSPTPFRNSANFQVLGTATGGGTQFIGIRLEGIDVLFLTTTGQNQFAAASAFRTAVNTALISAFGSGQYTIGGTANNVLITKDNGNELWVEDFATTDATQSIIQTTGTRVFNSMLLEATLKNTGLPRRYEDGYFMTFDLPQGSRGTGLFYHLMLKNLTGSPVSAAYRFWYWYDYVGWVASFLGTITESSGAGIQEQSSNLTFTGARKLALELIDNGSGSDLPAGSAFTGIVVSTH